MTLMLRVLLVTSLVTTMASAFMDKGEYNTVMEDILSYHNDKRRNVGAADMAELVWDKDLEQDAKDWAKLCVFEHADIRDSKEQGENLAFATVREGQDAGVQVEKMLKAWYDEDKLYVNGSGVCGKACHYTQMVWASTVKLGCAIEICNPLRAWSLVNNAMFLVCRYSKFGNMNGQEPFTRGPPCTKCPKGVDCMENLCQGQGGYRPCEDKKGSERCEQWAAFNQCEENPAFMDMYCYKSCSSCSDGEDGETKPTKACKDENHGCTDWAQRGECSTNPGYMSLYCKESCKLC